MAMAFLRGHAKAVPREITIPSPTLLVRLSASQRGSKHGPFMACSETGSFSGDPGKSLSFTESGTLVRSSFAGTRAQPQSESRPASPRRVLEFAAPRVCGGPRQFLQTDPG